MSAPIGIIDITFLYNYREEKTRLTWQPIVVFLIFLFSSFFYTTYSQSYYIKKYTVNDGLPASYIISIYQDTQGFMWISTYNGLSRFDGKEFINYGYESGLPYIICDAIYEDKKNHIWVGTRKRN